MHVIGLCPSKFVEKTSIVTVVKERKKNDRRLERNQSYSVRHEYNVHDISMI